MMPRMPRIAYIGYRVLEMLISLFSRFLNAAFLGGSTHQTTSARAHIETGRAWRVGRIIINTVFFWQEDHCRWAYWREVEEARKTLARADKLKSLDQIEAHERMNRAKAVAQNTPTSEAADG